MSVTEEPETTNPDPKEPLILHVSTNKGTVELNFDDPEKAKLAWDFYVLDRRERVKSAKRQGTQIEKTLVAYLKRGTHILEQAFI